MAKTRSAPWPKRVSKLIFSTLITYPNCWCNWPLKTGSFLRLSIIEIPTDNPLAISPNKNLPPKTDFPSIGKFFLECVRGNLSGNEPHLEEITEKSFLCWNDQKTSKAIFSLNGLRKLAQAEWPTNTINGTIKTILKCYLNQCFSTGGVAELAFGSPKPDLKLRMASPRSTSTYIRCYTE